MVQRTRVWRRMVSVVAVPGLLVACGAESEPEPQSARSVAATKAPEVEAAPEFAGPDAMVEDVAERAQLGRRFAWCADVQNAWDRNDDGLRAALAAVADYNEAVGVFREAIDELDRADALEQLDAREERAKDLIGAYINYESSDTRPGNMSAFLAEVFEMNGGAEGTKGVAYTRARDALRPTPLRRTRHS